MESLNTILNAPLTQIVGLTAIIVILQKAGIPVVDALKWAFTPKNGHTNGKQEQINADLFKHSEVANHEMSSVKIDIAVITTRLGSIEENMKEMRQDIKT